MNEKLEILQMIRQNRITPEEGVRLLEAMEKSDSSADGAPSPAGRPRVPHDVKWLNIEIRTRAGASYKSLTPVRIPFSLVRLLFRFLNSANLPKRDFDPDEVMKSLESGKPFEFFAEDGGRAIRITAE